MSFSTTTAFRVWTLGLLVSVLAPPPGTAQEETVAILRGQVTSGDDPLPGAMVVLHQVSNEASGEVDSIRAGADGAFRLTLPRMPDHGVQSEVFFASVRHRGLLYFGPAITTPIQLDSLYLIRAFDTLSVPPGGVDLPLVTRSLFLSKVEEGWEATDFFQVRQDGDRTLFSPEDGVTWQYPLPERIRDFEVGQADLAPEAVRLENGRLAVYSPIPPGERFFLIRYRIPDEDFSVPMPGTTEHMEVLVRDPGPEARFSPLVPASPVELEPGNVFRRFEGLNLEDSEVRAEVIQAPFQFRAEWIGLILAAVLGGAGVFAFRLRSPRGREEGPAPSRSDLIHAVARLDASFEGKPDTGPDARARYLAQRERLLAQINRLT